MPDVATRLSVRSLHPLFVAEITGIDLTVPVARDDFRTIWDAFNEHQILVFRDQPFDDESQIAYRRKLHRTTVAGTVPESALARMPAVDRPRSVSPGNQRSLGA